MILCLILIACGDDPTVKPAAVTNTSVPATVKTIAATTAAAPVTAAVLATTAPATTAAGVSSPTPVKTSPSASTTAATTGSPQASTKAKVTGTDGQGVRMRKEPRIPKASEPANIVVTIAENQEVEITGALKASEGLNWWPVTYKGQSGWVSQDYLKK